MFIALVGNDWVWVATPVTSRRRDRQAAPSKLYRLINGSRGNDARWLLNLVIPDLLY